jgi:hypothetical protein
MSDVAVTQNPALMEVNPPLVRADSLHDLTDQFDRRG